MGSPVVITGLADNTNYEGLIQSSCFYFDSNVINFTTDNCFCPSGYTLSDNGSYCYQVVTVPPTILFSNYCFAASTNGGNYSVFGARIYNPGFDSGAISSQTPAAGSVQAIVNTSYWASSLLDSNGPMNRSGVWVDSDCDGVKDELASGSQTTIAFAYNNPGADMQMYIGVGGDNQFVLRVNDSIVAQTTVSNSIYNFRYWHMIPVIFRNGDNLVNVTATGDGSTNDSIGMIIYNNTLSDLLGNVNSDNDLSIIFSTGSLRGQTYNIATCPSGYSLDTSGGINNYICKQTTTIPCFS
jgi:hypothetical protein